ncbi:MAG: 5-(carboxyamino)imidazole ribonucleotide mutase [Desulfovermiculus sp.]|nr:5-(carboxyamino)imidazole ribonucleotide mutase [Desulfovermiculus sp.]
MPQVAVFMGSISDKETMQACAAVLDQLGVDYRMTVTSAHRTPERTHGLVRELEGQGCQIFICGAGLAAHLAGAVAAATTKPVIGVPLNASSLGGLDALLSTVQMPPGFPVATLAVDKVGARNAAWMAVQILALQNTDLAERLQQARQEMKDKVEQDAASL